MLLCVVVALASATGGAVAGSSAPPDPKATPLPNGATGCEITEPPQGLLTLRNAMVVGAISFRCAPGYRPADVRISLEYHDPYGFGWSIALDQAPAKLSAGAYQAATACRPGIWALIPSFTTLPASPGASAEYLVMLGPPLIVRTEDCAVA